MAVPQPPFPRPAGPRSGGVKPAALHARPAPRQRFDAGDSATYRSFLHAPAGQAVLDLVDRQLEAWFWRKQHGAWGQLRVNTEPIELVPQSDTAGHSDQQRTVQYLRGEIRGGTGLRLTMQERGHHNNAATWTTQITAFEPDDAGVDGWVAIDITNDKGLFCATPRLAKNLLDAITLRDGISPVPPRIRVLDTTEELLKLNSALVDPLRRYPIVVVGTGPVGELDVDQFRSKVEKWTDAITGQGQVVMLTEHATKMFNQLLPERLRTPAWTLHTYLPGLEPDNPDEWSRHRLLSTRSLGHRPDGQIRGIITSTARSAAHASTFPPDVDEVTALLKRRLRNDTIAARRTRPVMPATPAPATPESAVSEPAPAVTITGGTVQSLLTDLERQVLQALGLDSLTQSAIDHVMERLTAPQDDTQLLLALLDEQDNDLDRARTDLAQATSAQQEAEDLVAELQSLNTDLEGANTTLREQNRYLQTELAKTTNAAAAYDLPVAAEELDDFYDIVERLPSLEYVEFTGDEDIVLGLDSGDHNGSEARNAWRALVSLDSYARHHLAGAVKTFKEYTEGAGPADCRIGAGKCVPTESETTINQFGSHRIFPVPPAVDPAGKVMMLAHIRLGQSDTRAPRLHYYDDVDGTGKVYVGYIGPHLPNTKTARS